MFFPKLTNGSRPMVYPEKPPTWNQKTGHFGSTSTSLPSREKKFRISKHHGDDFWQDSTETWTKSESGQSDASHRLAQKTSKPEGEKTDKGHSGTLPPRKHHSHHSTNSEPILPSQDYVPHAAFQGAHGLQSSNFKYKFYKKSSHISPETASTQVQNTFKPKGYGSLYDEMEFERRYKKVFDLNKHIHFVHSNFLSGQRVVKRTKLPPIGHVPNLPQNVERGGDIYAIMSVQKYNHPEDDIGSPMAPEFSPRAKPRSPIFGNVRSRRFIEVPKSADLAAGFVPANVKTRHFSNLSIEEIKGLDPEKVSKEPNFRLPALKQDTGLRMLSEENTLFSSELKSDSKTPIRYTHGYYVNGELPTNNDNQEVSNTDDDTKSREARSDFGDDPVPFNISVQVNIKSRGGDDDRTYESEDSIISAHKDSDVQPHDNQSVYYQTINATLIHKQGVHNGNEAMVGAGTTKPQQFGLITQNVTLADKNCNQYMPLNNEFEHFRNTSIIGLEQNSSEMVHGTTNSSKEDSEVS